MTPDQRKRVLQRIHADGRLVWPDGDEDRRAFIASLTGGKRSCADCTDGELLLVCDWVSYLSGRRPSRPPMRLGGATARQVEALRALAARVPPGYNSSPLLSAEWVRRTIGRVPPRDQAVRVCFELLDRAEATKLLAACKAIYPAGKTPATEDD